MKQISLFLILFVASVAGFDLYAQQENKAQLFEEITDIEKLIQQNAVVEQPQQSINTISTPLVRILEQPKDTSLVRLNLSRNQAPLDTLYKRSQFGTLQLPEYQPKKMPEWLTLRDTIIVNPLFLPVLFNGKILPEDFSLSSKKDGNKYSGILISKEKTFESQLQHYDFMRQRRLDFYREHPEKVQFSFLDFDDTPMIGTDQDVIDTFNPFKELISTETSYTLAAPVVDGVKIKRKYWTRNGDHTLHFTQNYFSPNWHKGGTNNFNIQTAHTLRFNYRKNKVKFNNTLEMRLALITAPDDTLRRYRISDDLLRYNADFGVDAFGKHWSYSTNMDARTQFFNNHPANSKDIQSAFLAPLYVNGGIGLRYNLDKRSEKVRHRRVRLSFNFDPASISFKYVGHKDVNVKRYGIEEGKKHKLDIGSTITGNLIFDFNKYISLNSRMRYFTSYHKVEAELENTLNMALTNAFSTRLFIHLRFDDGVPPDPKFKNLQVTELLSFGLNYRW